MYPTDIPYTQIKAYLFAAFLPADFIDQLILAGFHLFNIFVVIVSSQLNTILFSPDLEITQLPNALNHDCYSVLSLLILTMNTDPFRQF